MDVKSRLRSFIVENFMYGEENSLQDSDSFRNQGIIDSTGILELISFLEQEFNIKIEDDEIIPENLDSIDNIEEFINNKTSGLQSKKLQVSL